MASAYYGSVDTRFAQQLRTVAKTPATPEVSFGTRHPIMSSGLKTGRSSGAVLNYSSPSQEQSSLPQEKSF